MLSSIMNFFLNVLKLGPLPKHVAIIMDGNRRFARKKGFHTYFGHSTGKENAFNVLDWCPLLGIEEITLYAFSIENFKRPEQEVRQLMDLMAEAFQKFIDQRKDKTRSRRAVRILGDLSLLEPRIQKMSAELELTNPEDPDLVVNICLAYTSTHEITNAFQQIQECIQKGLILESEVNETLISKFLYSSKSTDPDLLLRTSGEIRLSDFLLWQSSYSVVYFTDVMWPEFTLWHFLLSVIYYQRNCGAARKAKEQHKLLDEAEIKNNKLDENINEDHLMKCMSYLEAKRINYLKMFYNNC